MTVVAAAAEGVGCLPFFFFWKCGFLIRRHILWSWKTARSVTHFIWMRSDVATALVPHTVWRFCYRRFIFMFRVIHFFSIIQWWWWWWWWWKLFSGRKGKPALIWVVNLLVFLTISQKKKSQSKHVDSVKLVGGGWHLDPHSVAVSGCQSGAVMARLSSCAPIDQVQVTRQLSWGGDSSGCNRIIITKKKKPGAEQKQEIGNSMGN